MYREIPKQFNITKLCWVLLGSATGQESIRNGLETLKKELSDEDVIMVHDENRPLITLKIISDSLKKFKKYGSNADVNSLFILRNFK
ncbi:hypothetical protein D9O40_20475 [Clostridium autoethanogenum]|uniref:2-C-methyl-D-erythritol 4-phosphate cytidylyltransferase n=1 Tax=Clostridium autoethanogenum TaxID=84023 RepID=A0A3M0S1K2_9CLOT|nr:2-C-methyl-D-erythritol 4-phosphate cytidylyltransferase [Clostridium autoethanogenum]RMC92305.1 hypothetical protein D9O40_20475 [Clostridium autoethanogenum]